MKKILISAVLALAFVPFTTSAVSAPCSTGMGSPLLVDVTQHITNDVDSGNHGYWAFDNYDRHIQVWADPEVGTYCAKVDYTGTFDAPAGALSPQNGNPLASDISGTFVGGFNSIIVGTIKASTTIPVNVDYLGVFSTGEAPGYVNWLEETFEPGFVSNFANGGTDWSWTYTTANNGVWVNSGSGSSGEIGHVVNTRTNTGYGSLQTAIASSTDGDTIRVTPGTYTEVGQIVIDKDLTIIGSGKDVTTIKPAQNTSNVSHADASAWIIVNATNTLNLSGVTLDGEGRLIAIGLLSHGHGLITNNAFKNIAYNQSGPDYKGMAIHLHGSDATVSNNTFSNIGRVSVYNGFTASSTITGNTFTGKGSGDWLDYAIEVGRGSKSLISNNIISENVGVATVDGSGSAGILVTSYFNPETPSSATVTGNTISNSSIGVAVGYDETDGSTVTLHGNKFIGNVEAVESTQPAITAENNWWGTAVETDISSSVAGTGTVDFIPWYADEAMTTLKYPVTSGTETSTITTGTETTTLSGTSGSVSVNMTIPAGTTVTGTSTWDGTLAPPSATTTTVSMPGFTTNVTSAITVGSDNTDLTMDKAVKLTFAGQAGKRVGWINTAGTFTEITTDCTANNQVAGDSLASGADCKIDEGADLVVWTKHLTSFVTYTATVIPPPPVSNGGGWFIYAPLPSPNSSPVAQLVATNTPNITGQVLGDTVSTTASQGKGRVLGANAYAFGRNMRTGTRGVDVTELQNILIAEGFLKINAPTAYFGPLTKAALVKWQLKNKLPGTGFFGPMSRGVLNQ